MFALIESCPEQRSVVDWPSRLVAVAVHAFLTAAAIAATRAGVEAVHYKPPALDVVWQVPAPATAQPVMPAASTPAVPLPWVMPTPSTVIPVDIPPPGDPIVSPGLPGDPLPGIAPGLQLTGTPVVPGVPGAPIDARYADEAPALLTHPTPRYPEVLRQAGIEGRVTVEAVIDTTGRAEVASLRVVSSAHTLFDREAEAVVLHSHYRPGRVNGRAVRVRVQVPVVFAVRS